MNKYILVAFFVALASAATTKCVNASSLNVRKSASTSATIVKTLANNTQVTVYSSSNGWAMIASAGGQYVSEQYLKDCPSTGTTATTTKCVTASSLNVRKSASTSAAIVRTLPNGASVTIYSTSNGWAKINSAGTEWVSDQYLGTCGGSTPTPTPTPSGSCYFPVKTAGFSKFGDSTCAYRNSDRSHAGTDLHTKGNGEVVAAYDGVITLVMPSFTECRDGCRGVTQYKSINGSSKCNSSGYAPATAVMIYHASIGRTFLYGELDSSSGLSAGKSVSAGQKLGTATVCGMLHFELYNGKQSSNQRITPSQCNNGTWPGALLNSTPYVKNLKTACKNL